MFSNENLIIIVLKILYTFCFLGKKYLHILNTNATICVYNKKKSFYLTWLILWVHLEKKKVYTKGKHKQSRVQDLKQ